jgi:peptidoglycan hydrolase-like protein with peptidoglycan-binding domain
MPCRTSRRAPSRPSHGRRAGRIGAGVAVAATSAGLLAAAPAAAAVSDAPSGLLKQGSDSSQVAQVQRALHLQASGRFGPKTGRAVRAFQSRDGLIVDGIIGLQTWDALFHMQPSPASASSSTTGTGAAYSSGGGYSIPSGIVQCESHGNYSAVNSSSGAGGAYQIMPSTWQAYGGQGLPQNAPRAEQDRIAGEIYAHQGPSAWTC